MAKPYVRQQIVKIEEVPAEFANWFEDDEKLERVWKCKYKIDDASKFKLIGKMSISHVVKHADKISVALYNHLMNTYRHHWFVIIKSTNWYWSVERCPLYVVIQRTKDMKFLCGKNVEQVETAKIDSLPIADHLTECWKQDKITQLYNFFTNNCQHFATNLYRLLANTTAQSDVTTLLKLLEIDSTY